MRTPTEQIASEGGQDARGDGHQESEGEAGRRELERGGKRLGDEGERGDLVLEGETEVAANGPGEESRVLHPQRIVEPQKGAKLPDVLLSRLQGQKETRGIPGQVKQPEHDHGYAEEDEDTLEKTAAQVGEHSTALPSS